MADSPFSISEALTFGWTEFKKHPLFFIGLIIVQTLFNMATGAASRPAYPLFVGIIVGLALFLLTVVFTMVIQRLLLNVVDQQIAAIPPSTEIMPYFKSFALAQLIFLIGLFIGLIFFILPKALFGTTITAGILTLCFYPVILILLLMFFMYGFIIMDKNIGPIEAFKESAAITSGEKWHLFLFGLVLFFFNVAGALCLIVGLFVTSSVSMIALAYVYRRLNPLAAA